MILSYPCHRSSSPSFKDFGWRVQRTRDVVPRRLRGSVWRSLSSSQRRGYRRNQEARTRRWISKKGKFSSGLVGRKFITLVTNEANYLSCSIGWGIISGITYDGKVSFEGIEFDLSGSRRNSRYRSFAVRGIKVWIFGGIFKWKFLSEA